MKCARFPRVHETVVLRPSVPFARATDGCTNSPGEQSAAEAAISLSAWRREGAGRHHRHLRTVGAERRQLTLCIRVAGASCKRAPLRAAHCHVYSSSLRSRQVVPPFLDNQTAHSIDGNQCPRVVAHSAWVLRVGNTMESNDEKSIGEFVGGPVCVLDYCDGHQRCGRPLLRRSGVALGARQRDPSCPGPLRLHQMPFQPVLLFNCERLLWVLPDALPQIGRIISRIISMNWMLRRPHRRRDRGHCQ